MTKRINIEAWGIRPDRLRDIIGGTAVVRDGERYIESVCRSIERRTGLSVVTCRSDGTRLSGGKPEAHTYELTLGSPIARLFGGGWSVDGRCFVAVPVAAREVQP